MDSADSITVKWRQSVRCPVGAYAWALGRDCASIHRVHHTHRAIMGRKTLAAACMQQSHYYLCCHCCLHCFHRRCRRVTSTNECPMPTPIQKCDNNLSSTEETDDTMALYAAGLATIICPLLLLLVSLLVCNAMLLSRPWRRLVKRCWTIATRAVQPGLLLRELSTWHAIC